MARIQVTESIGVALSAFLQNAAALVPLSLAIAAPWAVGGVIIGRAQLAGIEPPLSDVGTIILRVAAIASIVLAHLVASTVFRMMRARVAGVALGLRAAIAGVAERWAPRLGGALLAAGLALVAMVVALIPPAVVPQTGSAPSPAMLVGFGIYTVMILALSSLIAPVLLMIGPAVIDGHDPVAALQRSRAIARGSSAALAGAGAVIVVTTLGAQMLLGVAMSIAMTAGFAGHPPTPDVLGGALIIGGCLLASPLVACFTGLVYYGAERRMARDAAASSPHRGPGDVPG